MAMHATITAARILDLVERRHASLDDPGLCIACGEETCGVEPDARRYECEACGSAAVYGAEELLLRIV